MVSIYSLPGNAQYLLFMTDASDAKFYNLIMSYNIIPTTDIIRIKLCFLPRLVSLKVCHWSAFQTISVRLFYIKIINYRILANLSIIMQTRHHAAKKTHSYPYINKIYQVLFFVVEGFLAENVQNLQYFINSTSSYTLGIFETGFK